MLKRMVLHTYRILFEHPGFVCYRLIPVHVSYTYIHNNYNNVI